MAIPTVSITGIARNGYNFTVSWKKPGKWKNSREEKVDVDHYILQPIVNGKAMSSVTVSASKTSYTLKLTAANYYPTTSVMLSKVRFKICAAYPDFYRTWNASAKKWGPWKRVYAEGAYAYKDYDMTIAGVPSVTWAASENADQTTFTWTTGAAGNAILKDCLYQTQLTENHAAPNWNVSQSVVGANTSATITDTLDQNKSFTRWVRLRSRSADGLSSWSANVGRIYAKPNPAVIDKSSKASITGNNTVISMKWSQPTSAARPCSSMQPEYLIGVPTNAALDPPSGSYTAFGAPYTKAGSTTSDVITDKPEANECLFVHVKSTYLNRDNYSAHKILAKGPLTPPSIESITKSDSNHTVTINADNASACAAFTTMTAYYRAASAMGKLQAIGTVQNGVATTLQCPDWSDEDSFDILIQTVHSASGWRSDSSVWSSGSTPKAPTNVKVEQADNNGTAVITWTKAWSEAQEIELSWSQNVLAWESTDSPDTFRADAGLGKWYIAGLDTGKVWYFRARLIKLTGGDELVGPWSDITEDSTIDLSSAPMIPSLTLSKASVYEDETFNASWGYVSTDGTAQAGAEICEATISGGVITYGDPIETTVTEQSIMMNPQKYGWTQGTTHYLCVRVTSGSGRTSDGWSTPVPIYVTAIQPAVIASTSLEEITIGEGDDEREVLALTEMSLKVTITGAGYGGTTRLVIERVGAYDATRPDNTKISSPDGETIYIWEQTGEAEISVKVDDLIGRFDDGASYKLIATVADTYGKANSTESDVFEVHWEHQAIDPTEYTEVEVDEDAVAFITVTEPTGYEAGDYIDIYRLSVDAPELIVSHGEFGETYVDPYPAFGDTGGHRVVYLTSNDDYITEDESYAWVDLDASDGDYLGIESTIIDFGGARLILDYNLALKSSWAKDVQITSYLGGSVQGDWNPAVTRTGTVSGVLITLDDPSQIATMRTLADYAGICHVRTPDGSSYAADVQVSEDRSHENGGKIVEFSLSISKVDPEALDGMTLEEWGREEE